MVDFELSDMHTQAQRWCTEDVRQPLLENHVGRWEVSLRYSSVDSTQCDEGIRIGWTTWLSGRGEMQVTAWLIATGCSLLSPSQV